MGGGGERGSEGAKSGQSQRQVCTAENALPEESALPLGTPRPFHYKLLCFNHLLETMQTLIQKIQVQLRIFVSIQFPGFLIIAANPRPGLARLPLYRQPCLAHSSPVRLQGNRWLQSHAFIFEFPDLIPTIHQFRTSRALW